MHAFREFIFSKDFDSIQIPKLMVCKREANAIALCMDEHVKEACLAQSTKLHKLMAISSGFTNVFVIQTYFWAKNSSINQHRT